MPASCRDNDDKIDVRYVWTDAAHWYKPKPKPLEKWGKGEWKKLE